MWSFITSCIIIFILSIVVLFLAHHLIEYMKNTYTVKKTKDIVGIQMQKYKQMVDEIYEKERKQWIESSDSIKNTLSQEELQTVHSDLDEFMKGIL
jgi:predicted PurR-regulated permease PerM